MNTTTSDVLNGEVLPSQVREMSRDECIDLANMLLSDLPKGLLVEEGRSSAPNNPALSEIPLSDDELENVWRIVASLPPDIFLLTYRAIRNVPARDFGKNRFKLDPESVAERFAEFTSTSVSRIESVCDVGEGETTLRESGIDLIQLGLVISSVSRLKEGGIFDIKKFPDPEDQIALVEGRTLIKRGDLSDDDRSFCCGEPIVDMEERSPSERNVMEGEWMCENTHVEGPLSSCTRTVFYDPDE